MIMNQVTLPCLADDFHHCLEFYQTIGLTLIVHTHDEYARFEMPAHRGGGPPATLSIHVVSEALGPASGRGVIYFEVSDVAAHVEKLTATGIVFDSELTEQSWLWTEASLRDPAGNRLIIYHAGEARRFPPWRKGDS